MLRSRIIPCLLMKNGALYKTINFKDPKYVGDPINTVRIFNEKEVDEITILDIDASTNGKGPNYELIKNLAAECRMPLCYGGGINDEDKFEKIIGYGVEKVSINTAAIDNPKLIENAAKKVGSQSVVVSIDVSYSKIDKKYYIFNKSGQNKTNLKMIDWIKQIQNMGAGELIINSIDRDGTMLGYDLSLLDKFKDNINIPVTLLGGAGKISDISDLIYKFRIIGAAAGSLFVFKGKYKAVLINYPNTEDKIKIFENMYVK